MLKRYGDDAMLEACTRADHLLEDLRSMSPAAHFMRRSPGAEPLVAKLGAESIA